PVPKPLDLRDHERRPARLDTRQVDLVPPCRRGIDHDVGEAADVRGVERDGERVDPAAGCVGDQDLDATDLPVAVAFGVEHAEIERAGARVGALPALAEHAEQREDRDGREREQAHEVEGFEAQAAPDVRWLGRPVGAVLLAHRPRHSPPAVCGIGPAATARPSAPASRARTGPAGDAAAPLRSPARHRMMRRTATYSSSRSFRMSNAMRSPLASSATAPPGRVSVPSALPDGLTTSQSRSAWPGRAYAPIHTRPASSTSSASNAGNVARCGTSSKTRRTPSGAPGLSDSSFSSRQRWTSASVTAGPGPGPAILMTTLPPSYRVTSTESVLPSAARPCLPARASVRPNP